MDVWNLGLSSAVVKADMLILVFAMQAGQAMMNQVYANDEAGAVDLRLQLQHERAAAAQKEANLQAELEFIKNERSHAHKRADLHSRQMHELQVIHILQPTL